MQCSVKIIIKTLDKEPMECFPEWQADQVCYDITNYQIGLKWFPLQNSSYVTHHCDKRSSHLLIYMHQ